MARGVNKVILIGHLGSDPEIKYTQQGTAVANVSLATTEQWQKDGEKQSKTEWHKIVVWRKLAEIMGEWCKKGQQVYVEGKLQTDQWEKDGQKHYSTKVVIDQMVMLGGGQADGHHQPESRDQDQSSQGGDFSGDGEQRGLGGGFEGQQDDPDDIPF